MAAPTETASMALFCDFENVALGVRDAQYEKFDIRPVLERLLAKGSIVVKKAYCDWDRYKAFKAGMHEANFELIEIPHVRQSGKNSADIRLVVDALDLCYTKSHVDTFVIISGDSDFSPLVSKLRENAKRVIGVGVKQSCSDLLIANCDEFIYYDDLVRDRETERNNVSRRESREPAPRRTPEEEKNRREKLEARKSKAVELVATTFADLSADRGEQERIWASVLKEVIKRRNPGFNESYFGFRSFGNLLEEAANRGLLGFGRDEKSGAYVTRVQPRTLMPEADAQLVPEMPAGEANALQGDFQRAAVDLEKAPKIETLAENVPIASPSARRRGGRRVRKEVEGKGVEAVAREVLPNEAQFIVAEPAALQEEAAAPAKPHRRAGRRPRQEAEAKSSVEIVSAVEPAVKPVPVHEALVVVAEAVVPATEKPAKKRAPRAPRSRKPKVVSE